MDKILILSYEKVISMIGLRRLGSLFFIILLLQIPSSDEILNLQISSLLSLPMQINFKIFFLASLIYLIVALSAISITVIINSILENTLLGKKHLANAAKVTRSTSSPSHPVFSDANKERYKKNRDHLISMFDLHVLLCICIFFSIYLSLNFYIALILATIYLFISIYTLNFYFLGHVNGYILFVSAKLGRKLKFSEYEDLEKYF